MQTVFFVSAFTLMVPVAYHLQRSSETSSLDPNAPGMHCSPAFQPDGCDLVRAEQLQMNGSQQDL